MNILSILSLINIILSVCLFFCCLHRLRDVNHKAVEQLIITPMMLSIAMGVHQFTVMISCYNAQIDTSKGAGIIINFLAILSLIRLINSMRF